MLQYLLRDIIQFDESLQEAEQRITSANRTCDLILGVGDGKVGSDVYSEEGFVLGRKSFLPLQENQFRGVEYSASVADFFTWNNLRPEGTWHPYIQDVVYWGEFTVLVYTVVPVFLMQCRGTYRNGLVDSRLQ